MDDNNSLFISSNLTQPTFESYRVDLVMFVNNSSEVHYQSIRDYQTGEPLQLTKFNDPNWRAANLLVPTSEDAPLTGMVQTDEGPMLITAGTVYKSDETGPSRGVLVFGRLMGSHAQEWTAGQLHMDYRIYSEDKAATLRHSDRADDVLIERTDETSRIFLPIKSIDSETGFVVEFEHQRVISRQGQIAFNSFLAILIAAILATMLVIRRFMRRAVIDGLVELGDEMKGISAQEELPDGIAMARDDEIGVLANEFELMLGRLKQDQASRNEAVRVMTGSLADARRAERLAKLGTYEWDWELDKMVACSEEFARIWGMSVDEVLQTYISEELVFIHPDDRQEYLTIEALATSKGESFTAEYRLVLPGSKTLHIREVCEPELDDQGNVIRTRGSVQDITEQVQLQEQLRQAQKLEAIGQLSGGIAHDFNNMLVVILGNLESAMKRIEDGHPSLELLAASQRAARRAAVLTERLLTFARKQPLKIEHIELQGLLLGMKDNLQLMLGETVQVELQETDRQWSCKTDSVHLENVLLNLAINARDAMPNGGKFSIELDSIYLGEEYTSAQEKLRPGRFVRITLTDTGTGMSQEILDQAFDPFFTTKQFGEGTGLGLSMVYGFLKQCHGHVSISSAPGEGTSVEVFLPELGGHETQIEDLDDNPRGEGELVLVVEDEVDVQEIAVMFLEELGYKTQIADNAGEALKRLKSGDSFDLLFSDVVLPGGINGVDLAQWAVKRNPDLKVLLTSGYPNDVGTQRGAVEFVLLKKPYTQSELARKVRDVL